jgi:TusE/DsrC/DsvC family sulfur relay protein
VAASADSDGSRRTVFSIGGREIFINRDGFIQNPTLWTEELAVLLAREAGIEALSDKQWRVLRFIRQYYIEQGKAPMNHRIRTGTGLSLTEIKELFPGGISRGALRLAGLPKPTGCGAGS